MTKMESSATPVTFIGDLVAIRDSLRPHKGVCVGLIIETYESAINGLLTWKVLDLQGNSYEYDECIHNIKVLSKAPHHV